jgi:hypothetical protein
MNQSIIDIVVVTRGGTFSDFNHTRCKCPSLGPRDETATQTASYLFSAKSDKSSRIYTDKLDDWKAPFSNSRTSRMPRSPIYQRDFRLFRDERISVGPDNLLVRARAGSDNLSHPFPKCFLSPSATRTTQARPSLSGPPERGKPKQLWQQVFHTRKHKKYPSHFRPPGTFGTSVGRLSLGIIGRKVANQLRSSDLPCYRIRSFYLESAWAI